MAESLRAQRAHLLRQIQTSRRNQARALRRYTAYFELASCRFRNRFDTAQQKDISRDPQNQKSRRADKRSRERMCRLHDVTRKNRRSNPGKLIAKIQNASQRADALSWSNQRRNRPSNRRSRGQSANRHAYPEKSRRRTVCVRRAENPQA